MSLPFNTEPYFDDYAADKDFYRILFRPSYAVQARELTQIQTILQNQVTRFGDHVFKNGSQVIPGSVNVDNKVHFIKLEQFTGTVDITTYIETLKNKIITGETSGVKMRVLDTSGGGAIVEDLNIPTLYCKIEGTADDNITNRLLPGENIIAYAADNQISTNFRLTEDQLNDIPAVVKLSGNLGETATTYSGASSSDVLGYAYSVDVQAGIYYIDGIFVRNSDLKLYVGRFMNTPSCRVGFKITEDYVSPEEDESILDNATGSYNFAAPGAHRYKISLSLVKLDLVATDNIRFVELVRIVDGRVQQKIEKASYSELEKTFARRTHDESGSYEVNKFKLSVREHADNGSNFGVYTPLAEGATPSAGVTYGNSDKFVMVVDPGKAYINGYEVESTASQYIEFDKARIISGQENNHVQRIPAQTIGLTLGSYVNITNMYKSPAINSFEKVYLVNTLQPRVATARAVISGGVITQILVDSGFEGSGYSGNFSVTIKPTSAGGTGAAATANVSAGKITSITVTNGGSGYVTAPEVRLTSNIAIGAAATASAIVGTARVKFVQLGSGSYNSTSTVYKLGLFDIQMFSGQSFERSVKSIVGMGTTNFTADIAPTYIQLAGSGTVTTSNQYVTGSSTLFLDVVKAGDVVLINDKIVGTVSSDAGSVSNYSIKLTANALENINNGRITIFSASLNEPGYESLLFPVGQRVVKTLRGVENGSDTAKRTSVTVRRVWPSYDVTNNSAYFDLTHPDETFASDLDLSNYTLINAASNLPVNITESMITFDNDANRKKIYISGVTNDLHYLIASVEQVTTAGVEKIKQLKKDSEAGFVIVNEPKLLNSSSIDLGHGDIFRLVSITMTPGSLVYDTGNLVDITERYTLDNGQRDTYYTYGKVLLKPGFQVPSGAIKVTYEYFALAFESGNYFSVDSYLTSTGVAYEDIPNHYITDPTSGKKVAISLADVIDFRPILTSTNTFTPQLPKVGSNMVAPIASYLGRVDKITLDSVGKFNVIAGVPAFAPKQPEDPKEGLVLATVNIPPYTKNVSDIVIAQRDNRRYTMRDIGKLERRIANLEYYVTLSLLEKDTATMQVIDETTGLDRFKNGFIVDQFTGHGVGDVKDNDYKIAVDAETRSLRPMHYTTALEIVEELASGNDRINKSYQKTGDLITLPFTEEAFIFNNNATRAMDIHAISMGAFKGQVDLYPESDSWKSITRRPDLVRVDDNNYDAIKFIADATGVTETKWNEWQTNWTSVAPAGSVTSEDWQYTGWANQHIVTGYETSFTDWAGYNFRDGISTTLTSAVNTQDYGDRIVDMSYIPFVRSRPITFVAQNLKNTTRFWPFFDSTPVEDYVKPADKFVVQRVGNSLMSFNQNDLQNNVKADDPKRAYNGSTYSTVLGENGGRIEPAFGIGDVLTNQTHAATSITSINNLASPASSFTLVVDSENAVGIRPGHHVMLYNLDYHNAFTTVTLDDLPENQAIPASVGVDDNTLTSKELNLRKFKVLAVSGQAVTLGNIDGSTIAAFSAYSTDSYVDGNKGKLLRLKASGVVAFGGPVSSSDTTGPIVQEINLVNIKNGFAIGEQLNGSVSIGTVGSYNGVTVTSINGSTSLINAPTMNVLGSKIVTDTNGAAVGVFYIPESDTLSFRTGERTFKLSDNQSNSDASFDSTGSSVYYAQGVSLDKERTIVSTRTAGFVQAATYEDTQGLPPVRRTTTSVRQLYQYVYDPLAQTFTINSPGGCFITSVDLYFSVAGRRPITIEVRNTDNGVPSSKVIPFSSVTHITEEINVSDDSSVPTTFKFKSPIYLQDTETYAFVVMTDEPGAQLYVSEMGGDDMLTGNTIAGQPLTGSLYASQNAKEWEIHPLLDMKFTLNKAKFDTATSSEVSFRANPPELLTLASNPLQITKSSNLVRVFATNHGLLAGESVTISGLPKGFYGANSDTVGIPDTLLNTKHTVSSVGLEKDSFIISLKTTLDASGANLLSGTTADFVNGEYGGLNVQITRSLPMDVMYFKSSDLNFQDTKIEYYVSSQTEANTFTGYLPFVANSNYFFNTRMHMASYENQVVVANAKKSSLRFLARLTSTNPNLSPAIDVQQLSAYTISNSVNNQTAADVNVAEIDSRVLLKGTDVTGSSIQLTGTGYISSTSTGSTAVVGATSTTTFTTQVKGNGAGNKLYRTSDNALIGTVSSVTDNEHIVLTGNAAITISTNTAFYITSEPNLVFENVGGFGVIRTNIDTADNLLASASIGKTIVIANVNSGVNGTYVIKDINVVEDKTTYAGNTELDTTKLILDRAFTSGYTMNLVTDTDFTITILDKFVADHAPVGVHNAANYITRTLTLSEAASTLKIIFDANIVNNTAIKVYYRTWTGDVDLRKLPYNDSGFVSLANDPSGKFIERSIDLNNLQPFNNVQIKIVMKSSNAVFVPKVKNLRLLALS